MILRLSNSQFWDPGFVCCLGLLSNRSGVQFQANSDFLVHMCVHMAILFDENLDVCASPGALALHARIFIDKLHFSIMNHGILRQWKMMNQKNSHFVFMCCSFAGTFSIQKTVPDNGSRTGSSAVVTSIWENYGRVIWTFKFYAISKTRLDFHKMSADAKIKPSPQAPAYYSHEHTLSW